MSNKTGNADTTEATCPRCGHALWGHTEFPGLWCCFYDAALDRVFCRTHAQAAVMANREVPFETLTMAMILSLLKEISNCELRISDYESRSDSKFPQRIPTFAASKPQKRCHIFH